MKKEEIPEKAKVICGQTCDCKQYCIMNAEKPVPEELIKQLTTDLVSSPPHLYSQ